MTRHWFPLGTQRLYSEPKPGQFIAFDHAVWRVIEVNSIPTDLWTDEDRQRAKLRKGTEPRAVVLRPARITGEDPRARDHDRHFAHRPGYTWEIYPTEHYPICAQCHEPLPCRDQEAQREAERSMKHLERYLMPGVCPCCQEPVTSRAKSRTFEENVEMPGGPPVTFHIGRSNCRYDAAAYEKRWVAVDPDNRRVELSCSGSVVNHNDGTYECSAWVNCNGPTAFHPDYRTCDDRECRAKGAFGCHPWPDAKLRQVTS